MNSFDIHYITLLDNLEMEGMEGYFRSIMHRKKKKPILDFITLLSSFAINFVLKKLLSKQKKSYGGPPQWHVLQWY